MIQMLKMYARLPRNIFILFFVKFINAFGDFVVPFLSLYLTTKLGFNTALAGSVVTITVLLKIPGSMFGGILADRWTKKNTYILAQGGSAVCILLCGFLTNHFIILALLLCSSFVGAAVRPVLNAFVYDLVGEKDRKTAYSFLYLGINVGVAAGPLVSGFLFNHYLTLFFLGDALTSFVAVCLVLFFVKPEAAHHEELARGTSPDDLKADINTPYTQQKSASRKPASEKGNEDKSFLAFFIYLLREPKLSIFFVLYLSLSFMYAQHSFSLPLLLKELYPDKSAVYFGSLMSVNAITVIVATTFITYLTRKKSLLFGISCSAICMALGFGLLAFPLAFPVFIPSTILWTFGEILLVTNTGIYVVQHVEASMRARSSAFQSIISSCGSSLGILLMSGTISRFGIRSVWPIIFILGLLTFAGMLLFEKKVVSPVEETPAQVRL